VGTIWWVRWVGNAHVGLHLEEQLGVGVLDVAGRRRPEHIGLIKVVELRRDEGRRLERAHLPCHHLRLPRRRARKR
jgi:hypothetical protein